MAAKDVYRELGEAAWAWVMGQVRGDDGPWLPEVVSDDGRLAQPGADRDSLYAGIAGLAPVLAEISQHRALTGTETALAAAIVKRLKAAVPARIEPSLYDGLGGDAMALRMLAPGSEQAALSRLAELATQAGWKTTLEIEPGSVAPLTDLISGNAGVVLAAIWVGGEHAAAIAATGGEALLRTADRVGDGLDWAIFLASGVPQRLRPGFWDNDGRCCGTAGVGDILLDAAQDYDDQERADTLLGSASAMADALAERAISDSSGVRWRFTEHRNDPPLLPPGTSWMQGAAGIAAFLLRMARVTESRQNAPVVDRPDQWWAVPARLRTFRTSPQHAKWG